MDRKPLVVGNWKMHGTRKEARELLEGIKARLGGLREVEVGVAPPFTALETTAEVLADDQIKVASQNVHYASSGAFTGEVSPGMLKELGVDYAIVGHSERRSLFWESDEMINRKVRAALGAGLGVILCVGETLDEREAGRTWQKVSFQVKSGLEGVDAQEMQGVVIAYEPVWAIGTGRTATPAQAQSVHADLRALLVELYGHEVAQRTRLIYGGSVKPDNAAELMREPDIDGALVGGASLKADSFDAIVLASRP